MAMIQIEREGYSLWFKAVQDEGFMVEPFETKLTDDEPSKYNYVDLHHNWLVSQDTWEALGMNTPEFLLQVGDRTVPRTEDGLVDSEELPAFVANHFSLHPGNWPHIGNDPKRPLLPFYNDWLEEWAELFWEEDKQAIRVRFTHAPTIVARDLPLPYTWDRRDSYRYLALQNYSAFSPTNWAHVSAEDVARMVEKHGSLQECEIAQAIEDYYDWRGFHHGDWGYYDICLEHIRITDNAVHTVSVSELVRLGGYNEALPEVEQTVLDLLVRLGQEMGLGFALTTEERQNVVKALLK